MPAKPEPSANVRASTRLVSIPTAPAHGAVLRHCAHLQAPAGVVQQHVDATGDECREPDDEDAVQGQLDAGGRLPGARQPRREGDADLLGAENRTVGLLQDQAQAPGGQQRVEGPVVEVADEAALQDVAEGEGHREGERNRHEKINSHPLGQMRLEELRCQVGHVGAKRHQLAVGHVDHAHQPEHDRQADRHQQQNREQADSVEHLHHRNIETHLALQE